MSHPDKSLAASRPAGAAGTPGLQGTFFLASGHGTVRPLAMHPDTFRRVVDCLPHALLRQCQARARMHQATLVDEASGAHRPHSAAPAARAGAERLSPPSTNRGGSE